MPFENLTDHLVAADIVVSSTGSPQPIITRRRFEPLRRQRRYRPIFLIDIAVPRNVEPSVGEIENVYLYNVDDLQQVVANTLAQRKGAIEAARAIVTRQVEEFAAWHRQREMGPIIDRLYRRYHRLAKEELDRTLNKLPALTPADRSNLEEMTRRLVNKLLHSPIRTLRTSEGQHTGLTYLHAMEKLFDLGERDDESKAAASPDGEIEPVKDEPDGAAAEPADDRAANRGGARRRPPSTSAGRRGGRSSGPLCSCPLSRYSGGSERYWRLPASGLGCGPRGNAECRMQNKERDVVAAIRRFTSSSLFRILHSAFSLPPAPTPALPRRTCSVKGHG